MEPTILITGGAGFIGANLVSYLLDTTNWHLIILDRLDSTVTLNRLIHIPTWSQNQHRVKFIYWDLKAEINQFTRNQLLDTVYIVHLAASSHVDRSIRDPYMFVQDNVLGTLNILNLAKSLHNLLRFYHQSTDEVMGPALKDRAFTEEDATNPCNPYAASKAGAESIAISYATTYNLPLVIGRCMNVYGVYQHPEKFLPLTIRKIQDNDTVLIHSDITETVSGARSYISADNLSKAIFFLLKESIPLITRDSRLAGIYNIAGEEEISNLNLALRISEIMQKEFHYKLVGLPESRPGHDLRYALDGSKLNRLGWNLEGNFYINLGKTVSWYLSHSEWLHAI